MSGSRLPFGPVQMLVLEFERTQLEGEIAPELERLNEAGIVRVLDLLFVRKPEAGELEVVQKSDLDAEEAVEFGAMVGALVGFGAGGEETMTRAAVAGADELADGHLFSDAEVWYLADAIPEGSSAAVLLLEHRWAIPLRDKIIDAGGTALADAWIHPSDLVAVGTAAAGVAAGRA
jgi:uncharacterized membrane protein